MCVEEACVGGVVASWFPERYPKLSGWTVTVSREVGCLPGFRGWKIVENLKNRVRCLSVPRDLKTGVKGHEN